MAHFHNRDLVHADSCSGSIRDSQTLKGSDELGLLESKCEDDFNTEKLKSGTETTATEVRNGKDVQGIHWERMTLTRGEYREKRLREYESFENLAVSREKLDKDCMVAEKDETFYDFHLNTRVVKPTVVHFQECFRYALKSNGGESLGNSELRDLLWATSKHDVYVTQNYSVTHWSAVKQKSKEVLNVAGPTVPTLKNPGTLSQPLSRVLVSTMIVKDDLLVIGGLHGELICKCLDQPGVVFSTKLTENNSTTNAVDIFQTSSGSKRIMTANNDVRVRIFDVLNFSCLNRFSYSWSINNTTVSPDGELVAVLGDSTDCLVVETQTGKVVSTLKGHLDYSFASAWHPDGRILATGNQDMTCRLWDIRNTSKSLAVLKGRIGAIRGLKFSSDGRFMAMAEAADFVHIFNVHSGFEKAQEIDLFGEIAGISFSPDNEALFLGIADRTYGSVLEFTKKHQDRYLGF